MTQRIQEIWRVLKPNGSFYFHCDPTMSHYLKLILDSVFVARGGMFRNEIIWCYKRWANSSEDFQKMHDSIFRYSKTKRTIFNKIFESIKEKISDHFEKGYTTNTVKQGEKRITQLLVYDETKAKNKILEGKYDKLVLRNGQNRAIISDWWEIPVINSQAKERLGYPTQKLEKLLERIIKASSNEGDTVLDCFCGCGTTISVCQKLNRKWIGIDINYQAISLIEKRLFDAYGAECLKNVKIHGIPKNVKIHGIPRDLENTKILKHKKDVKFDKIMDCLNDRIDKKELGAFYTPKPYCKKAAELVREAIKNIPEGNDYIILDRCAGTGNLEEVLTDEELSHTIISTIEYYEYLVLLSKFGTKVREIIPPTAENAIENLRTRRISNADALSKEYVENSLIKQ
jgi:DNA modification methylase